MQVGVMQLGEGFAGSGPNAAHVNTVLGSKDGPVGHAWTTALATPRLGHAPFVVVARPNIPVKPFTLFVNKSAVDGDKNERHARFTWGAAQAAIAAAVVAALQKGIVSEADADALLLIAAVWVNPAADDENEVYVNNEAATLAALTAGRDGTPTVADVLAAGTPQNPFFTP
jgi:5,6,7,8-tetrahydromethanopterin hydro-lyase